MRISTRKDDPGYENFRKLEGQDITVTRDGVEIPANQLVVADEEEGLTVRVMTHDDGTPVIFDGEFAEMPEYGEVKIVVSERPYNAADEIRRHQNMVKELMTRVIMDLHQRASVHDDSKFSDEEYPHLQKMGETVQREGKVAFGTPEYEARKAILAPMLEHHFANNDHHIQHHADGILGMTLLSVVEMFCDICAAGAERNADGVVDLDLDVMARQGIPVELGVIFRNTAKALEIPHK